MRALIPLVLGLFLCHNLSSQVKFGLRTNASIHTSSPASIELVNAEPFEMLNLEYQSTKSSIALGGFAYGANELLFFMAEALYQKTSSNFNLSSDIIELPRANNNRIISQTKNVISIPISAGLLHNNFKFGVGPIFNFTLASQNDLENLDFLQNSTHKINGGFQFLIGYKIADRIHIDIKREIQFASVAEDYKYRNLPIEIDESSHKMSLSIGVLF